MKKENRSASEFPFTNHYVFKKVCSDEQIARQIVRIALGDMYPDIDLDHLAKRSRFTLSVKDAHIVETGTRYENLPTAIIIFICTYDPYGLRHEKYVASERLFDTKTGT